MKTLLIVESPAKSKTIEKLLGPDFIVKASFGHIRELGKKNELGVDVKDAFRPIYYKMSTKSKQIQDLEDTMKRVDRVLLAADEDREGEAIAWHCAIVLKISTTAINRICFHEITKSALEHAVNNPRRIDMNMVHAQQARQILDKLVGYEISPLLWRSIGPALSAGRVQSVCLKLIVGKEREVEAHTENKYFRTVGHFKKNITGVLIPPLNDENAILEFFNRIKSAKYFVESIESKIVDKRPPPPYTTSSIQQDLGTRFNFPAKRIMGILQHLYESGKITYHRTDSTNLSKHIMDQIKDYVNGQPELGKKYSHPRNYLTKSKAAQEAHEAIRPTYITNLTLEDTFDESDRRVYQMIWRRTVASQMTATSSEIYTMNIGIQNNPERFIAKAERIIFDGYKKIYDDNIIKKDNGEEDDQSSISSCLFDEIKEGDIMENLKVESTEKYHEPPGRYSEASIIKKMEVVGIGRPSTYASILNKLFERSYIEKKNIPGIKKSGTCWTLEKKTIKNHQIDITIGNEKNKLVPTEIGKRTSDYLISNFDMIVNEEFTSVMENNLDKVASGDLIWNHVVSNYYDSFHPNVEKISSTTKTEAANNKKTLPSKKLLGEDDGKNIYVYSAKFGPVYQIGEDNDKGNDKTKKYIKLPEGRTIETTTLDDYRQDKNGSNHLKIIGEYNQQNILLKKGKYGFYLSYNDMNYRLKDGMDENLTFDEAKECISVFISPKQSSRGVQDSNSNKSSAKPLSKPFKQEQQTTTQQTSTQQQEQQPAEGLPKKIGKYFIKNGPYGPYVQFDKIFASIPKTMVPNELTEAQCKELVEDKKKGGGEKKTFKR